MSAGLSSLLERLSPFAKEEAGMPRQLLPPQTEECKGRLCVVLDMDETLIHSEFSSVQNDFRQSEDRQEAKSHHDFKVVIGTSEDGMQEESAFVYIRPGLAKFIERGSQLFELVVFTAALPIYAKPVLDRIDPNNRFSFRLYRDSTMTFKGQPFVKDLTHLGRDLRRTVLIDNNPYAMLATPDNAMPILSFYDDPTDYELDKAIALLQEMKNLDDIRPYLKKRFKFREQLRDMLNRG